MSVYVDDARIPYGRMIMCHMLADSSAELKDMARRIEVDPRWIQNEGTYREHFDICLTKRAKAVFYGAREITQHELGEKLKARKPADTPTETKP